MAVRHHDNVVIGDDLEEIGIRRLKLDQNLHRPALADVLDRLHRPRGTGLGFAAMQVERIDRVLDGEGLAVAELDALAQVQHPFGRAFARLPALGKLGDRLVVRPVLDQAVEQAVGGDHHHRVGPAARIETVRGAAAGQAEPQMAAFARRVRGRGDPRDRQRRPPEADGRSPAHEIAPREAALREAQFQIIELVHRYSLP